MIYSVDSAIHPSNKWGQKIYHLGVHVFLLASSRSMWLLIYDALFGTSTVGLFFSRFSPYGLWNNCSRLLQHLAHFFNGGIFHESNETLTSRYSVEGGKGNEGTCFPAGTWIVYRSQRFIIGTVKRKWGDREGGSRSSPWDMLCPRKLFLDERKSLF